MCVVTETNVTIFQLNYGFLNVLSSVVRVIFCLLRYVSAEAQREQCTRIPLLVCCPTWSYFTDGNGVCKQGFAMK